MTDPLIGHLLKDAYRIEELIADGGMSRIYLAEQVSLARKIAIKMLLPSFRDDDFIQLFLREARVCSQLNHPNIVSVLDFGSTEDGLVYLVMEYLEGASLADIVNRDRGLTLANIVWLMEPLCSAIRAAHQHNVVHRDLKPGNVMIAKLSGNDTTIKVVDFGISKPMNEEHLKHTQLGTIMGTPGYLAPEQIRGININHLADVYGLGAILHFMITGEAPFRGVSREIIMNKQLKELPPPLASYTLRDPSCQILQPIIYKAMAIEPEQRYATVQDLIREFQICARQTAQLATPDSAAPGTDDPNYQFVFSGQLQAGKDRADAAAQLQSAFKFSEQQVTALFSGKRVVVRKNITLTAANRFRDLFAKCGALGAVEEMDDRTRIVALNPGSLPDAGVAQPISVASFINARGTPAPAPALSLPTPSGNSTPPPAKSLPTAKRRRWPVALGALVMVAVAIVYGVPAWRYALLDTVLLATGVHSTQRGIDAHEIRLGMSAAFSGSARELGRSMQMGMLAYFNDVNDKGGIHGRTIALHALDDGYEPGTTLQNLAQFLLPDRGVFALVGNVGTPTTRAILPQIFDNKILLFAPFSGAQILRNDPPDRYVFNYRASYAEETAALVHYFVKVAGIHPQNIAVFYQNDSYGRDGLSGVANAISQYGIDAQQIPSATYQRNSAQVTDAIARFRPDIAQLEAVIIIGTYMASSRFINLMRVNGYSGKFANVSFVGAAALAEELKSIDSLKGEGVIVSQVVPMYDSHATGVLEFQAAMQRAFPNETADFVALEGYIVARLLCEALHRSGRYFDTESLIDELEKLQNLDLGIGKPLSFSESDHQASHQIWGTVLDANGQFQPLDLERINLD